MTDTTRDRLASVVVKQLHRGEYAIVDAILDELLEPGEGACPTSIEDDLTFFDMHREDDALGIFRAIITAIKAGA